MSSGDLLEDLRSNRQRVVVPDRDDPLLQQTTNTPKKPEQTPDLDESNNLSKVLVNRVPTQQEESSNSDEELDNYPSKLKRLTIRLDEEICLKLNAVCSRQTLTAETLIESLFCQCDANPNLMKKVLKDAKERYKKRKQAGVKKRVASMQQKYGD